MKSQILDRPMFKKSVDDTDIENVGIMQGFMDEMEAEDELENDEDYQTEKMLDRRPDSPEILMNNLRGDMRSIDARVEELADLVGYNAAAETPEGVLALLQPVLAAQQAPQMPPMPPGMMPPPPMPPEGMMPPPEMPPEAAMGGIGALPADQGPMTEAPMGEPMPAPVAMAMGGYVQRFSDGSDEDGVTPSTNTSSFAGVFSPEIIQAAREQVLSSLNRGPMPTPDLATEVEKRTPLYERLMGVDPNLSQAQILFELGQRAFNYGANVDDQGRPLRGSQAARLAGAVRTLPGAMGNIIAQQEQQRRAVKGAALQATEKDIQNVRESNAKLVATQAKLWEEIAKSSGKGMSFGTGTEGTAWSTLTKLAPDYAAGTLPENMVRMFDTSLAIVSKPIQYTDEYGRLKLRETVIPDFVKSAVAARANLSTLTPTVEAPVSAASIPTEGTMTERSAVAVAETGSGDRAKQEDIARRFKTAKEQFDAGKMPKAAYDDLVGTLNEESKQIKASVEKTTTVKDQGPAPAKTLSLWSVAKDFTGPISSVRAGATSIPSLGGTSPEVTRARSYASSAINQIVAALGTTARFGNVERQQIKDELGLTSSVLQDPMKFRERLVGLDALLTEEIDNARRIINDNTVPVELQKEAERSLAELTNAQKFLGIPRITSREQAKAFPMGTFFLYDGQILEKRKSK